MNELKLLSLTLDFTILFLLILNFFNQIKMSLNNKDFFAHSMRSYFATDKRIDREVHVLKKHNEHLLTCINDLHGRIALLEAKKSGGRNRK